MRRTHAVTPVVEDAAGENGRRAFEPDLSHDGIGSKLGLSRLKQLSVEDWLVLSWMGSASIDHFADVEPVLEDVGNRSGAKADTTSNAAVGPAIGLGSNAALVEVINQSSKKGMSYCSLYVPPFCKPLKLAELAKRGVR